MNTSTLYVTTQRRLDRHEPGGYWFRLSEYSDMAELHTTFARCFPEERVPQFRFREWADIPDELVREDWLCEHTNNELPHVTKFPKYQRFTPIIGNISNHKLPIS